MAEVESVSMSSSAKTTSGGRAVRDPLAQREDNLAALDVCLEPKHVAALDAVSKPKLNFPADLIAATSVSDLAREMPFDASPRASHPRRCR